MPFLYLERADFLCRPPTARLRRKACIGDCPLKGRHQAAEFAPSSSTDRSSDYIGTWNVLGRRTSVTFMPSPTRSTERRTRPPTDGSPSFPRPFCHLRPATPIGPIPVVGHILCSVVTSKLVTLSSAVRPAPAYGSPLVPFLDATPFSMSSLESPGSIHTIRPALDGRRQGSQARIGTGFLSK